MKTFILPGSGNSITTNDIDKGILRITVEFKEHFPNESAYINITFDGNKDRTVSFTHRTGRSHVLRLGTEFMKSLKPGQKLKFTVVVPREHFTVERV